MTNRLAGIDVGGTFTDLLFIDDSTKDVRLAKVPSTTDNQGVWRVERAGRRGR